MSALTDDVQADKCLEFQALHESPDAFIIPNPWDVGSARIFQGLGFKALATTSSGFAYTLGKNDGGPTLLNVSDIDPNPEQPRRVFDIAGHGAGGVEGG